jgi:hypothetical protein
MKSAIAAPHFHDDNEARKVLEAVLWPDGPMARWPDLPSLRHD